MGNGSRKNDRNNVSRGAALQSEPRSIYCGTPFFGMVPFPKVRTLMENTLSECSSLTVPDELLIGDARNGDQRALEELILRHQTWIFKIALKLTRNLQDAEDVTQDVLLVIITKLATYKGRCGFRGWLYRIITNHVINMKKKRSRGIALSFDQRGKYSDEPPIAEIPDPRCRPVELPLMLEEVRIFCMMGMLLCLDLEQRMIFVLGDILEINDMVGSRLFEISRVNYRKKLSRARKSVYGFMRERCG
jgi:RNA polymerase sigma factor (sigma-70 family)